jgi:hypothetical protein
VSRPGDSEALEAARSQTEAMGKLADEVRGLRKSGRRTWKFVLFDITLTVLLTVVSFIAVHAGQSAHVAQVAAQLAEQDNRNLCESSNVSRAQQLGLWDYLFALAGPAKTAEGTKLDNEFLHHVAAVFAPRNCVHVDPGSP